MTEPTSAPDEVMTWTPQEVRLLRDASIGAGHLGGISDDGVSMCAPPVVFALLRVNIPGKEPWEDLNLIVAPKDAVQIGLQLLEMGTQAMGMKPMGDAPTDIVDRT